MSAVETVKVKQGDTFAIINKADFDPNKHELAPGQAADAHLTPPDSDVARQRDAERLYEANRGISGGPGISGDGRNPSGTFSEPTPSDIRYPNKDETEFENNHGAFVKKSAAEMREAEGLPDAPGGLAPDAHYVGKGPRGKYYVKKGTERLEGPFDTKEEADAVHSKMHGAEPGAQKGVEAQAPPQYSEAEAKPATEGGERAKRK